MSTCPRVMSTCPRVHLHTASGERDDTCERYSSVPECFKPCPAKCEQSFRDQVTTSSWCSAPVLMPHYPRWRTRSARGSPPPPRCPTATTPPAPRSAWTRPRTTSVPDRWHGHTLSLGITTSHFSWFQCQKFKGNRACCGEECPAPCMEAAARGECLPECKQYAGNPKCCRFVTDDDVS